MRELREYVRLVLEEKHRQATRGEVDTDELLLEPDEVEQEDPVEEHPGALATISSVLSIISTGASLVG